MPRKNTPGCGPCCDTTCGPLTVQVRGCNGLVLPGAAVTATQAGYPDVAGTTDAAGRVALTMPACGGWTLHVADGLATPRFGDPAQFVSMPGGPQAVTVTPTPLVDFNGTAFRIIRGVACAAVAVDPAGNLHWQDTCAQINATLNTSQVNLTRNCPVAAAFAFSGSTTLSQIYGATAVPITGSE
jgi:hypothetical protein